VTAPSPAAVTAVSWTPRADLALSDWVRQGRRFGALARGSAWWIGDWLVYGNAKYGEKYVRAAKITGYDAKSLMNMVYVASRFEISRRRENLSWSHHAAVAALEPEQQELWLALSERHALSVHCLRRELGNARRRRPSDIARAEDDGGQPPDAERRQLSCPRCGHTFAPGTRGVPAAAD
jgi:hypothetical protein